MKVIDVYQIPKDETNIRYYSLQGSYVINTLRENYSDEDINAMTPNEIFDAYLAWLGIMGFSDTIKELVDIIYEVDLWEVSNSKRKK